MSEQTDDKKTVLLVSDYDRHYEELRRLITMTPEQLEQFNREEDQRITELLKKRGYNGTGHW